VGTFRIVNGQKVGGNVASYFCLADQSVLHAIPGQVNADKLLAEARFAYDNRKAARMNALAKNGKIDMRKYYAFIQNTHQERFNALHMAQWGNRWGNQDDLPATMPLTANNQAKAHWLLATQPLAKLDTVYPTVWRQILGEQLSALPVDKR
jgi:hypothetical protein